MEWNLLKNNLKNQSKRNKSCYFYYFSRSCFFSKDTRFLSTFLFIFSRDKHWKQSSSIASVYYIITIDFSTLVVISWLLCKGFLRRRRQYNNIHGVILTFLVSMLVIYFYLAEVSSYQHIILDLLIFMAKQYINKRFLFYCR